MAVVLRGKYKGEYAFIRQWCNDWISVDIGDHAVVLSPASLQFTPEEFARILNHNNNGILLNLFEPDALYCRFKRKKLHGKK